METVNQLIDECLHCDSGLCVPDQCLFKNLIDNLDIPQFDSFLGIDELTKKDCFPLDLWNDIQHLENQNISNNGLCDYNKDVSKQTIECWSSSPEEVITSDYSDSMSPNQIEGETLVEEVVEEEMPIGLTTVTLYSQDQNNVNGEKNRDMFSATVHAFEIHNYSCNRYEDSNINCSNTVRKVNYRGSKSRTLSDNKLTDEEKRLLAKEGYENFPIEKAILTKHEEKILRKIRRKIRNKRSAQCSRQRKKQYLEELERKYEQCSNENDNLKREVLELKKENETLLMRMKKMIYKDNSSQASFRTSLFVLIISFLLILMPCFRPDNFDDNFMGLTAGKKAFGTGRNLLTLASGEYDILSNYVNETESATINYTTALSF